MKLSTHLKVSRKVKSARALLRSARVDLINDMGARPRPDPRTRGRRVPLNEIEILEDLLSGLNAYELEARLLDEHPGIPMLRYAWRNQDIGAVTWVAGRNGRMVAMDKIKPIETNTPILLMTAQAQATETEDA